MAVIVAAAGLTLAVPASQPAQAASCHHVRGPFHVRHGHMVTGTGARYTPYGINVNGLTRPGYSWAVPGDEAQEDAAAAYWCANTIRISAAWDRLITSGGAVNSAYQAEVRAEVAHAGSLGMAVVLTAQTGKKITPRVTMPTRRVLRFWRWAAARYGRDRQVIFDLFNEPGGGWRCWRHGCRNRGRRYYGMEHTARVIRAAGARNMLWVEGVHRDGNLRGVPARHLTGVGPVAYEEHRPGGRHTRARWNHDFGSVAGKGYPVVVGEWTNYATSARRGWACWHDAPSAVPRWLRYLTHRRFGLLGFGLARGRLIRSAALTDTTRIESDWACKPGLDEGAGHQLASWFVRRNARCAALCWTKANPGAQEAFSGVLGVVPPSRGWLGCTWFPLVTATAARPWPGCSDQP